MARGERGLGKGRIGSEGLDADSIVSPRYSAAQSWKDLEPSGLNAGGVEVIQYCGVPCA